MGEIRESELHPEVTQKFEDFSEQLADSSEKLEQIEFNVAKPHAPFEPLLPGLVSATHLQSMINYCITNKLRMTFPALQDYTVNGELVIEGKLYLDAKESYLRYTGSGDFVTVKGNWATRPIIKNLRLTNTGKKGTGLRVVLGTNNNSYGASIILDNFYIAGFKYGIRLHSNYRSIFMNGHVRECEIGLLTHARDNNGLTPGAFSNMISFEKCEFNTNDTALKLLYIKEIIFNTCVFEANTIICNFMLDKDHLTNDYNHTRNIHFRNPWFEVAEVIFANGEIDSNGNTIVSTTQPLEVVTEDNPYYFAIQKYNYDEREMLRQHLTRTFYWQTNGMGGADTRTLYVTFGRGLPRGVELKVSVSSKRAFINALVKHETVWVLNGPIQQSKGWYEPTITSTSNEFAIGDLFYDERELKYKIPVHYIAPGVMPNIWIKVELFIPGYIGRTTDTYYTSSILTNATLSNPVVTTDIVYRANPRRSGTTAQRPLIKPDEQGFVYFDTTLNKPIFWGGINWIDSTGTIV